MLISGSTTVPKSGFRIENCRPEVLRGIWFVLDYAVPPLRQSKRERAQARFLGGPRNHIDDRESALLKPILDAHSAESGLSAFKASLALVRPPWEWLTTASFTSPSLSSTNVDG